VDKFKKIVKDILYLSKITKTKNKKILIISSVALSQLTALSDILLIAIFSALIVNQFTTIEIVNNFLNLVIDYKFIIIFIIIAKYTFQYIQSMILKKIELNVNKNLKIYFLNEIFDKRNYSVADSYFYINTLTMHISYFYSSFANFLNSLFQILAFSTYLVISDTKSVIAFSIGIVFLFLPIKKMLSKSRMYMHESYEKGQESSQELQRVVDNLFLIKLLKKENYEKLKFENTLEEFNFNLINNHRFGIFNTSLPGFFTLIVLSTVLVFTSFGNLITLDFVGVTLRLFQSLSLLTTSMNQIINSHVHIEKFYEVENNKYIQQKQNFILGNPDKISFNAVNFKYFNSDEDIFNNLTFTINKNTHTTITGPNGSGKSTILGLLSGVFYPTSGSVSTFSDSYSYIGATPLIFTSSLYENVMYGNKSNIDEKTILELLRNLDIFKEESNYDLTKVITNKSLSSGQMQKIAFVRALLSESDILLLDEATANLDETSKDKIFNILKEKKITIVNSTHDPNSFKNVDNNLNIKLVDEKRIVDIHKV
tara:strand:- start:4544 stop:6160 length:1617 start_codon:yes stop_codon:yes gene_type:complete